MTSTGAVEARRCGACGSEAAPESRFCAQCGTALAQPGAGGDVGELKTVSVLFADMSGSVAAAAGKDPEAVTEFVNAVLHAMVDVSALRHVAEATTLAEQAGDVVVLSRCHTYRAVAHRFLLDEESCRAAINAMFAVSEVAGMHEYIGAAEGHLAWLARRSGRIDDALAHAERAIDIWSKTELIYGFQWIARFPLLAIAHAAGDMQTADDQVEILLAAEQQRLPREIEDALKRGDVADALHHGERLGYA